MSNKKCLVYETLGNIADMKIMESSNDGCVRLTGVFGVCGIKNGNNRIYNKENYGKMVESLQNTIMNEGCLGELEHPNSMNINLENVSHKIESIEMNEDGTITGTIRLLNTPKGQIAKAIVEGGCPLFISSRGAGSIDESGNVTLSMLKTYDLVGTPGFSQAKLNLKENQTLESLNENLAIVFESDDLLDDSEEDKKDDKKKEETSEEPTEEATEETSEEPSEEPKEEDNKDKDNKVTMEEIKKSIDALTDKVTALEAELHVAQESLNNVEKPNYEAIEEWVNSHFASQFKESIMEKISDVIDERVENAIEESIECFGTGVQNWINEEFTPVVESKIEDVKTWISEDYAELIQGWITEEYTDSVQTWINEEFAGTVESWISEEFSTSIEGWINEEFAPAQMEKINENINCFMEAQKADKFSTIDKMIEALDMETPQEALNKIVKEQEENNRFKGVYVVENMPAQFAPVWAGLSEAKQDEIVRSARMYDFTKEGVLESFWNNADLNNPAIVEQKVEKTDDPVKSYHNSVAAQMKRFGKW